MATAAPNALVLTFHSISNDPGPTCIPLAVFEAQMDELADSGRGAMTLDAFLQWRAGPAAPAPGVLITFDDALVDFANLAHPILRERGFPALMFAPTGKLGARADWDGDTTPKPIMDWDDLARLAKDGVTFGGHGVMHQNLTTMPSEALDAEIKACAHALEARLGMRPRAFAAPFGAVNPAVVRAIGKHFEAGFGTRFDKAAHNAPIHDIPRIDMHYFRDRRRWRGFLDGETMYFTARQTLRTVRQAASGAITRRRAHG